MDAAAEMGRRLAQSGKVDEAIRAYADAFTLPDGNASEEERVSIRRRMGELYEKQKGSQAGLGDLVLQAYDRNAGLLLERREALKAMDPNSGVTNPMRFTLTGCERRKVADVHAAGQSRGVGFLGHVVRPVPGAASAL